MSRSAGSILLLALGNDIMGDDGVAFVAARALKEVFGGELNVLETTEGGLGLIDILSPHDRVLLLDSIQTGDVPVGTIQELSRKDFDKVLGPSPHYAGLPEVIELARGLGMSFPSELRVLAIKIDPPEEFREGLSPDIHRALPGYVKQAEQILRNWVQERAENTGGQG